MSKEELCDLLIKYKINIWLIKRKDFKYYHTVCDYKLPEEIFNKVKSALTNEELDALPDIIEKEHTKYD